MPTKEYMRNWVLKHPNYYKEKHQKRLKKNPNFNKERYLVFKANPDLYSKMLVRSKLRYAIKMKRIIKLPCQVCGNTKSEGHHPDYSKPFEVEWLCREHHAKYRRKN